MTQSDQQDGLEPQAPGSAGRLLRKWAAGKRRTPVLRTGLGDVMRGAREGDQLRQMIGWVIIGVGVYQYWRRRQTPSLLYSAYLDVEESVGIRVMQKGNIVGEFPVGRSGG